ncbi:MAG TPA: hypothetical protein DCK79_03835 [Candidatus Atribacteria bacterium]|nr:hypothetical protein [Candidatus Atribacteria bacterium]
MSKQYKPIPNETSIKKQIKDYLSYLGWYSFPLMQGLGSQKGLPDRIAIKDSRVLFLEIKTLKGKQSEGQIEFEKIIKSYGGEYYVVRSIEDVDKIIQKKV